MAKRTLLYIYTIDLNFCVTHIYREGNQCAYQLANLRLILSSYSWFNNVPPQVNVKFVRNKTGFPNIDFANFSRGFLVIIVESKILF